MPKLGLGTVQLGVPYGTKNQTLLSKIEAFKILEAAEQNKISFVDTAVAYGCAEGRIGLFLKENPNINFEISTKISSVQKDLWNSSDYYEYIKIESKRSLERIGQFSHNILQFHQCDLDFLTSKNVISTFNKILDEEVCSTIGASVYTVEQAIAAINTNCIRSIQIPLNIVDRRFMAGKIVNLFREKNIFGISRSLFLQGVLFENNEIHSCKASLALEKLRKSFQNYCKKRNYDPLSFCLAFLFKNSLTEFVNVGIIGFHSFQELNEICLKINSLGMEFDFESLLNEIDIDEFYLNPSNWDK